MRKVMLIAAFFAAASSFGQDSTLSKSSHYKAAAGLMEAMDISKTMDESIESMVDMQSKQNPMIAAKRNEMLAFFRKYMSWSALRDDYIKLYMEELTEVELNELTKFYQSPVGKKIASKQATLGMKGALLGQQKIQSHMDELMSVMQ